LLILFFPRILFLIFLIILIVFMLFLSFGFLLFQPPPFLRQ